VQTLQTKSTICLNTTHGSDAMETSLCFMTLRLPWMCQNGSKQSSALSLLTRRSFLNSASLKVLICARWRHSFTLAVLLVVKTIKYISLPNARLLVFTGQVMEPYIRKHYPDITVCKFSPKHARNLQNEFFCCSTYLSVRLGKRD